MFLLQIFRPVILNLILVAGVFHILQWIFGSKLATQTALVAFVVSNVAISILLLAGVIAAWLHRPLRIVFAAVLGSSGGYFVKIGLPLSYIVVYAGLTGIGDMTWAGFLGAVSAQQVPVDRLGVALAYVFTTLFADVVLKATGFPGAGVHRSEVLQARIWRLLTMTVMVGVGMGLAFLLPGGLFGTIFIILPICILIIVVGLVFSWLFARSVYFSAEVADDRAPDAPNEPAWAIHLTDIHLTYPGDTAVEGGDGGREALAVLAGEPATAQVPAFVLSGDVTDHGSSEEWAKSSELISPWREAGAEILVAPGNHDLSPAYEFWLQFAARWAQFVYGNAGIYRFEYGLRLWEYMHFQAPLADDIRTSYDTSLADEISRLACLHEAERNAFQTVAAARLVDVQALGTLADWAVELGVVTPQHRDQYFSMLQDEAEQHLSGFSAREYRQFRGSRAIGEVGRFFPLRYLDKARDLEVLILNSVVFDDDLVASAAGDLADEELGCFARFVEQSTAQNLVVVIHHPPFRWHDESAPRFGLDAVRWNSLAMSNTTAERLGAPLEAVVKRGTRVALLCGHRHGGVAAQSRIGTWRDVVVCEGNAFTNPADPVARLAVGTNGLTAWLAAANA